MAKVALIKLRCSAELKDRLTELAKAKEQSLSDYIRIRLIDQIRLEEDQAPYGQKKRQRQAG